MHDFAGKVSALQTALQSVPLLTQSVENIGVYRHKPPNLAGYDRRAPVDQPQNFDAVAAHRFFSADCFNKAWELIDKRKRTPEEDEQMLCLNQASLWHWSQRADCTNANLSIGYWQAARIHTLLGRVDEARRYGHLCLQHSPDEEPFLRAYAYEALARAESLAGDATLVATYAAEAARLAAQVTDAEDREQLLDDLKTVPTR